MSAKPLSLSNALKLQPGTSSGAAGAKPGSAAFDNKNNVFSQYACGVKSSAACQGGHSNAAETQDKDGHGHAPARPSADLKDAAPASQSPSVIEDTPLAQLRPKQTTEQGGTAQRCIVLSDDTDPDTGERKPAQPAPTAHPAPARPTIDLVSPDTEPPSQQHQQEQPVAVGRGKKRAVLSDSEEDEPGSRDVKAANSNAAVNTSNADLDDDIANDTSEEEGGDKGDKGKAQAPPAKRRAVVLGSPDSPAPAPQAAPRVPAPAALSGLPRRAGLGQSFGAGPQGFTLVMAGPVRASAQKHGTVATVAHKPLQSSKDTVSPSKDMDTGDGWQAARPKPTRLGGLSGSSRPGLGSLVTGLTPVGAAHTHTARRVSGPGAGAMPGLASSETLRTVKLQDADQRQRAAQQALQQRPPRPPPRARGGRTIASDADSDDDDTGRDRGPSLLARVEAISEGLRAQLGEGTLGDRYAGLSGPVAASAEGTTPAANAAPGAPHTKTTTTSTTSGSGNNAPQALVTREMVCDACGSEVGAALKGYQLVGINFLTLLSRSGTVGGAILADEMGLGKTAQTIVALGVLQHDAKRQWRARCAAAASAVPPRPRPRGPRPHLIICPASLLENWQRELKHWGPTLRVVTYYGKDRASVRNVLTNWLRKADKAAQKQAKNPTAIRKPTTTTTTTTTDDNGDIMILDSEEGAEAMGTHTHAHTGANGAHTHDEGDDGNVSEDSSKGGSKKKKSDRGGSESESESGNSESGSESEGWGSEEEDEEQVIGYKLCDPEGGETAPFDVLLTTYSLYERDGPENRIDRQFVNRFKWSHLVADEAHALKNRNSTRVQKMMKVARACVHRLLLTGTPLQNDINELLNLLRFLMPSLFHDEEGDGGGDEDTLTQELLGDRAADDAEAQAELVSRVRRILSPFILRRLKSEVANQLVDKTHKLMEVDMTASQSQCYKAAVAKFKAEATGQTSAQQNGATSNAGHERAATPPPENPTTSNNSGGAIDLCSPDTDTHNIAPTRRKTRSQSTTDLTHTEKAAGSKGRSRSSTPAPAGAAAAGGGGGAAAGAVVSDPEIALKRLGASRVANIFTHLRKIALHPLLVRQRYDDAQVLAMAKIAVSRQLFGGQCTLDRVLEEMTGWSDFQLHSFAEDHSGSLSKHTLPLDAAYDSGKLCGLRTLLRELHTQGHRVLLFSQWTLMMDVIEWFLQQEGHNYVRLDGSTQVEERLAIVDRYNHPDSDIFLFLLSTRAGGQGLNLTGADTVILHDVDFNPQVDKQAEDRCHRLGQTRPVTVYRLVTQGTVDRNIYEIAQRKLDLDAAIIGQTTVTTSDVGPAGDAEESEDAAGATKGGKGKGRGAGKKGAGAAAGASAETRHMGAILAALLKDQ